MMSAAHALIEMPTECGRTTARNGQQYLDVLPTNPLAISLDEGSSSSADEIGNLERRRGHWGTSSSNVTHTYIKAAGRSLLRSSCAASAAGRLRPNAVIAKLNLPQGTLRFPDLSGLSDSAADSQQLLQFRVLCFGLLQDGDVRELRTTFLLEWRTALSCRRGGNSPRRRIQNSHLRHFDFSEF